MQNNQKIPEGWSVKKIGNAVYTFSGGTPSAGNPAYYKNGTIPFIRSGEIYQDFTELFITEKGLQESSAKMVNKGDLLFALYGANSGEIAISQIEGAINQAILCIRLKEDNVYYLKNSLILLKDRILQKYLQGGQGNLSAEIVKSLKLLFPPLPEQEKIAGILGMWDEAIEKLSSLIEQKKLLKKGLMQRLLTGKTRLKGFTQPWKEVKLGDMCKMFSGGTPLVSEEKYYKNGNIPFIRSGEISSFKTELFITEKALENSSAKMIEKGDLLYALYGATSGEIAISKINGAINQAILCIRSTKIEISYLYYVLLNSKSIILSKYLQGGQGNLSADIVKKLSIKMPSDANEQKAIADVLSTADEEIDLLNKKLEALKEQKKGLMQQLLTGQTRVKVN